MTVAVLGAALAGCQGLPSLKSDHVLDNASFMTVWETYRHCEQANDVEVMREDAMRLASVARQTVPTRPTVPGPLEQYVSDPPHRLAVEPASMAAACGLHAGQTALESGRLGVADEMFRLVLSYSDRQYAYYLSQARLGLDLLHLTMTPQLAKAKAGEPLTN